MFLVQLINGFGRWWESILLKLKSYFMGTQMNKRVLSCHVLSRVKQKDAKCCPGSIKRLNGETVIVMRGPPNPCEDK
jgi:hypothetical protein